MKKTFFTILFLQFVLFSINAKQYKCWLEISDADSVYVYRTSTNFKYVYPLYPYRFSVQTNSGMSGSGVGQFSITLKNGAITGNVISPVTENTPFQVKWNDVKDSAIVSISKIASWVSSDTIKNGSPIKLPYLIATLKGQAPTVVLTNTNPLMGNTQAFTAMVGSDMAYDGIKVKNDYGMEINLLVDRYEWTLPSGWSANGQRGSVTFNATTSKNGITITPDAFSTGEIKVRAMNLLQSAGSDYKTFTIDRGFKFTSYPASIAFGDNTAQTFSVTAFSGLTYEWSVPAGWQINGQGSTLEDVNLNSVSITPCFCSIDTIKVRLKTSNAVSGWFKAPTQIINLPSVSCLPTTVDQYKNVVFTLRNIDLNNIDSVSFSKNVAYISNQGASYTVMALTAGTVTVSVNVFLKGCTTPIILNQQITVNLSPTLPLISGPSIICPGSTGTFTVKFAPTGYSWGCSSNLTPVSGSSGTFKASSSTGDAWISINIGNTELVRKNITISNGTVTITGPGGLSGMNGPETERYYATSSCSSPSYTWKLYKSGYNEPAQYSSLSNYVDITAIPASASYNYMLEIWNENSIVAYMGITVRNATLNLGPAIFVLDMLLSPNPASAEINIEITDNTDNQPAATATIDPTYTVSIVDATTGIPVYKGKKKGKKFNLSTAALHNGVYNVIVSDGVNTYQKKLIVKH